MSRSVAPVLGTLAAGLVAGAVLAGCGAASRPGAAAGVVTAAAPATAGADGQSGSMAGPRAGTAEAAGDPADGTAVQAPGATMWPALPSPKDFVEAAGLEDVHFDFDRHACRSQDSRVLDANARWLQAHPGTLVLIEGHADERGTNEYNLALAEHRARTTREQLVARGVAPSRIATVSYGEERPACASATEDCWARNRRAHFLVTTVIAATTQP
jgi:peptidoglycan-associated lipoprotein